MPQHSRPRPLHAALTLLALVLGSWTCSNASGPNGGGGGGGIDTLPPPVASESLTVAFSTYLGGTQEDMVRDAAVTPQGNLVVVGSSQSTGFPTPGTGFDHSFATGGAAVSEAYVVAFSPQGTPLWSNLIGGPNFERFYGVEVSPGGSIFTSGRAGAAFPVTAGVFQPGFAGGNAGTKYSTQDGLACRLAGDGSAMTWCSYFGDSDNTPARDVAIDAAENLYVVTSDSMDTYPSAWFAGSYQPVRSGKADAVVAKLSSDGTQVLWATYLGGTQNENHANSVRVDATGVYVLTFTHSADMPTTAGAASRTLRGTTDLYVAKLSLDGKTLLYGTYLGGSSGEAAETHQLAIDAQGNAYVTGMTSSSDFPTTAGAAQRSYGGDPRDGFVAKLSPTGGLIAATYVGGNNEDFGEGIGIDAAGNVVLSGGTSSPNFATNQSSGTPGGGQDAFLMRLTPTLGRVINSLRFGGSGNDIGRGVATAADSSIVFVGMTSSANWPMTGAYQPTHGGSSDGFIVRLIPAN